MKNPTKWYSRRRMGLVGVVLIAIGIWVAIIFLSAVPILSLLLFALIGGPGVFIAYKRKNDRWIIPGGFWIASWGYVVVTIWILGVWTGPGAGAFAFDFVKMVVPVVALGTLPFAWLGRRNGLLGVNFKGARSTRANAVGIWLVYLLIIIPFAFTGMWDYNMRADMSPPEVMTMKVVEKYISDDLGSCLRVETPDGNLSVTLRVSVSYYHEHDIGSFCEVIVRRGVLGYPWVEGYG